MSKGTVFVEVEKYRNGENRKVYNFLLSLFHDINNVWYFKQDF